MKDNLFRAWDYKFKEFCYFSAMGGFQNLKRILNIKNIDQYINRNDTNGQKIYENDIVEYYGVNDNDEIEKMIAIVEWCLYGYFFNDQCAGAICTIIGNIYENPELLEQRSSAPNVQLQL